MQLITQPPTSKAPAEMFTGDAWWDVIHRGEEPSRARANMVHLTTWLEHVSDTEYGAERSTTRR
ncbi:hypothetical protein ACLQ2R_37695 [Streptosporangium sp. DT93]|uniref:hypothetical protein n=1 Tax=Streptosporangium sp. DT93 TaxID=3393428 RepID=UPI003CE71F66